MLSTEELKKRIHAARILRGLTQEELQARLTEDGLGRRELGRVERGDLPLTRVRRVALADALGVPELWFISEDVDPLIAGQSGSAQQSQLDRIEQDLQQLVALLAGDPEAHGDLGAQIVKTVERGLTRQAREAMRLPTRHRRDLPREPPSAAVGA